MSCRTLIAMSYLSLTVGCATQGSGGVSAGVAAPSRGSELAFSPSTKASGSANERRSPAVQEPTVPLRYPRGSSAWFGVEMRATPSDAPGVRIERVFRGSPAEKAGLRPGDVVLRLGEEAVDSPQSLADLVLQASPGEEQPVAILRQGRPELVRVVLEGRPEFEDRLRLAFVGRPPPSIDGVVTFQGEETTLRDLRGRVVVLEFWASWCGVCRYLAPVLNRLHLEHRPAGLSVMGITMDPPEQGRAAARRTQNMDYSLASDVDGEVTRAFLASQVPTVFVIDRRGIVVDVMVGVAEARLQEFEQLVERLVEHPTS